MSMTINGRNLDAIAVLRAVQKHLDCKGDLDLEGNITHVIRTAYRWRKQKEGIEYHFKDVDSGLRNFWYGDADLPQVVYDYFAEVVDPLKTVQAAQSA